VTDAGRWFAPGLLRQTALGLAWHPSTVPPVRWRMKAAPLVVGLTFRRLTLLLSWRGSVGPCGWLRLRVCGRAGVTWPTPSSLPASAGLLRSRARSVLLRLACTATTLRCALRSPTGGRQHPGDSSHQRNQGRPDDRIQVEANYADRDERDRQPREYKDGAAIPAMHCQILSWSKPSWPRVRQQWRAFSGPDWGRMFPGRTRDGLDQ
jgi:hypothetical protein